MTEIEDGFYENVVRCSPAFVVALDPNDRILMMSDTFLEAVGYTWEEVVGEDYLGLFVPPEEHEAVTSVFTKLRRGEKTLSRNQVLSRSGKPILVEWRGRSMVTKSNDLLLYGAGIDITERVAAHQELRRTLRLLDAIFNASPQPIFALDCESRVTLWNRAAEKLFGWSAEQVIGRFTPSILDEEVASFQALIGRVFEGETFSNLELKNKRKDGELVNVRLTVAPLRGSAGETVGVVAHLSDITEQREVEEKLSETERQLRQSQRLEAVGRLAGGVSHDFNNMLGAIMGFTDVILTALDPSDPLVEDVTQIKRAADRASALTKQLLAFSRTQILQAEVFDLNDAVSSMEQMLGRLLREDIELRVELCSKPCHVRADPGQMEQVIMNLAVNGRDAMPDGGKLTIRSSRVEVTEEQAAAHPDAEPGDYVAIEVADTGCGMDAETRSHIFEPFFTTKKRGEGSGLGLSTVYGIVRQSGGYVTVESKPGEGTSFRVFLPRARPTEARPAPKQPEVEKLHGDETVLVVEDEEAIRVLVTRILKMFGYDHLVAQNGGQALLICEKHPSRIDLMITDVVMPDISGPELERRLRPIRPEMKTLYMSGYNDIEVVRARREREGSAFIPKPFTARQLARKVRELLDST
jgi:PAS domain S-box-containing protein